MKIQCTNQQPRLLIATLTILAIMVLFIRDGRISSEAAEKVKNQFEFMSRRDVIWTAKGPATYEEVNNNVFLPNNLRIVEYTYPIPRLDFIQKPSCAKTFKDWLAIANEKVPEIPPKEIEEKYKNAFLLNGYTELQESYFNPKRRLGGVVWGNISTIMTAPKPVVGYKEEGLAVHHALRKYPVTNMTGFVIGSEWAWVEVLALHSGATEVLTVEYRKTKIVGTERIRYVHPIKFAEQWSEYGDPIDPVGDLREAQKVQCLLKKGGCKFVYLKNISVQIDEDLITLSTKYNMSLAAGKRKKFCIGCMLKRLFYLGIPRGKDAIIFNAHRVYGRMRLAMIMTGFEWLATFRGNNPNSETRNENDYNGPPRTQDVYVLKKL